MEKPISWIPKEGAELLKEAIKSRDAKALWWGEWRDLFGRLGNIAHVTNYLKIKEENDKKQ